MVVYRVKAYPTLTGLLLVHFGFILQLFIAFRDLLCRVVISADVPYIKMVSEQFDRCHGTLLQYVEFLSSAVTPASAYALLIPTLDELVHLYHLDPEVFPIPFCASVIFLWNLIFLFNPALEGVGYGGFSYEEGKRNKRNKRSFLDWY